MSWAYETLVAWGPTVLGWGGFGALLGAAVTFVATTVRDRRIRNELEARERAGLLRLIDTEVYVNTGKLRMIRDDPDIGEQYRAYSELHTSHWDESRGRLVQLLPKDHTSLLARYYAMLHGIGVNAGDEGRKLTRKEGRDNQVQKQIARRNAQRAKLLSVQARDALGYGEDVREKGREYIGDTPDYFELYGEE